MWDRRSSATTPSACYGADPSRPSASLDCVYESICERCGFFDTGPQFIPILRRQRDHALERDQHDRAEIFTSLIEGIDNQPPDMIQ